MSHPLPRALVFGGRVMAGGLWFDRRHLGETEARLRVLRWVGRAREVLDIGDGYLLRMERALPLHADRCPGSPVIERDGVWLTAPLRPEEHAQLGAPSGSLVLIRDGRVETLPLGAATPVDVATWLDVEDWALCPTEPLGAPGRVATPTLLVEPEDGDLPRLLAGRLPPPDPRRKEILEALAKPGTASTPGGRPGLLDSLGAWLNGRFGSAPSRALGTGSSPPPAPASPPASPSRFRQWLMRMAARSQLGQIIGRRQAEYLDHTKELFERGRWGEALRHAIPFSSLPGAPKPPSFSLLSPRDELSLPSGRKTAASTSMHLGDDLYARFKELYAQAARDLEEQGRIEEAAYVLFELLDQTEEGVAMLERHEHYELAARMAEGRGLPPGRVIRLWFLAGRPARAIVVARRTGAFADAVGRLERNEPGLAARLRLLWADRLAGAGDYAAAVDVALHLPEAHRLARAWIDRAIELGGPTACRMLPRKLALWPDDPIVHEEVTAAVEALLSRDDQRAPALRRALGEAWPTHGTKPVPVWSTLATAITRELMVDAGRMGRGGPPTALLRALDDPVLRHDISGVPMPRVTEPPPREPVFEAHERGLTPIEDAVALPNGQVLLALGDAGLRLVDAQGKILRAYEHPASRLVMADSEARAIALCQRGRTSSLRRIDLITGRADLWCDARFDLHARSYDGAGWFLTTEDALALVDAQAPNIHALWRVGGLPSTPAALGRSATHLSMALPHPGRPMVEVWTYELTQAGPMLRERRPVELPRVIDDETQLSVDAQGWLVGRSYSVAFSEGPGTLSVQAQAAEGDVLHARGDHVLLVRSHRDGTTLYRLSYESLVPAEPILELRGSRAVHAHPRPNGELWVVDERGRVVALDAKGTILRWMLV